MSRPWTEGPWATDDYGRVIWPDAPKGLTRKDSEVRTYGYGCGNNFVADLNDGEYHEYADRREQNANAALIALAPRMAEAILNYSYWNKILTGPNGDNEYDKAWIELDAVATELRKIIKEYGDE